MRYILLIYSKEVPERRNYDAHWRLIAEAERRGVFVAAEPLEAPSGAATVHLENGRSFVSDGPFAETKEQLAGFYVLDCQSQEEAMEWAARVLAACGGTQKVEVRRMPGMGARSSA